MQLLLFRMNIQSYLFGRKKERRKKHYMIQIVLDIDAITIS